MDSATKSTGVVGFSGDMLARIHQAACLHVELAVLNHVRNQSGGTTTSLLGPLAERTVAGVFVTLKRGETLRGCCGLHGTQRLLADALAEAAIRTAKHDPRMAPISDFELPHLHLSVSILGPPRTIEARGDDRVAAVIVGQHGLRIRMAGKTGLLLPSVARDQKWSSREFLEAICFKAGLPPGSWLSDHAAVEVFNGIDFTDRFQCSSFAESARPKASSRISVRAPAVSGRFYPAHDRDREAMVDELLADLPELTTVPVSAAMVPHAGLRYSGQIAAEVWRRIEIPESVVIIGPKHTSDGVDWAIAPHERWDLSPAASMMADPELAVQIARSLPDMELDAAAHAREHAIEVQLPLLYRLAPRTRVTGIVISNATIDELERAAERLAELLKRLPNPPLLVISSDMNHFADDAETRRRDRLALDAMQMNDPLELLSRCSEQKISMCGRLPAALVLMTLKALGRKVKYREIAYGTSGDITGDLTRVVGYAGILL